jgi:signal transduction histidine kinase
VGITTLKYRILTLALLGLGLLRFPARGAEVEPNFSKQLLDIEWEVRCFYSLPNGLILCGTEGGLLLYDGFKTTEIPTDRFESVNNLFYLNPNTLLVVRENTIVELNLNTWTLKTIYKSSKYKNELFFSSIKVGKFLYIGTSQGLQQWDIEKHKMTYLTTGIKTVVQNGIATRSRSVSYNKVDDEVLFGIKSGTLTYKFENGNHQINYTDTLFRCLLYLKKGGKEYRVSNSYDVLVKETDGSLKPLPISTYFDSGYTINNIFEYQNQLLISTVKNGTLVYDFTTETFIKNHPIFGSVNGITAVCKNRKNNEIVIGTYLGLVTITQKPKTFTKVKDGLPSPVHGCHAVYNSKSKKYYYVSKLQLIEFDLENDGFNAYDISEYFKTFKNITLDLYGADNILIYGKNNYIFFDVIHQTIYTKAIFNAKIESLNHNDLIIDTYHSADEKITIFATYHSGLLIIDKSRDTQYVFKGSDFGMFSTVCKIHPISKDAFLMGSNGYSGAFYLNLSNFKTKYFSPKIFDKYSVSKSYIRNIFDMNGTIYFTAGNALWEYDKVKNEIVFSSKRSRFKDGALFYLVDKNVAFLSERQNIFVLTKQNLSMVHSSPELYVFSFLIPLKTGVGVYSGHSIYAINYGKQFNKLEMYVSHIAFKNRIKLCNSATKRLVCRYDDPLVNLSFYINYPHFNEFDGKIYYTINDDNNWQILKGNEINFNAIKPGKYKVGYYAELKGENTAVKYFTIIIRPPWYLHPLFWAVVVVLLIVSTIILVKRRIRHLKQKKLHELELVLNSLEAERGRISKDLHDGVSPNLSALKMILSSANLDSSKMIIHPEKLIDTTLDEIKEILHNITPDTLRQNGLAATISNYISNTPYEAIHINFNSPLIGHRYSDAIEINVYRMFQEIFNNAIKYADCKEINIELFKSEGALCLMVSDDGKGFDTGKKQSGFGIQNIKSRVELVNGTVNFDSSEKSGTTVIIKVPLNEHV